MDGGDVDDVLRHANRGMIERKIAGLHDQRGALDREIAKRERFLALLDEWLSPDTTPAEPAASEPARNVPEAVTRPTPSSTPGERREAILSVLRRDRHREWSTEEIRDALDGLGVSFEGGTPLKTLLFRMKESEIIERPRMGAYKLPAERRDEPVLERDNGQVQQEVLQP